jgi:gliding motility-associated-like protein
MNRARQLLAPLFFFVLFLASFTGSSQSVTCPVNIGFEGGDFTNWVLTYGSILQSGSLDLTYSGQRNHEIIPRANAGFDEYGDFPRSCPNGSGYSIQIGDKNIGAQAERVSYTFTIPAGQNDYSIIYHYAVVLQNPNHAPYQQPKFQTEVYNVSDGAYVDCPSFEFVAGSFQPGFLPSIAGPDVFYKPWAAVTLDLYGLAGKTIRLDFTSNDCSQGGHFGYAYLDIDEDCASPIKGNIYCGSQDSITLKAPYGFQGYQWYDATVTTLLGTGMTLTLAPPPPNNTVLAVIVTPYPELGCIDTLYTTIDSRPDLLSLVVKDTVMGCASAGANLMAPGVTAGSTPGLRYSYYTDPAATTYIPLPDHITISGKYYINATNSVGCTMTKPVYVKIAGLPNLVITNTVSGCSPPGVNLTAASVTAGSDTLLQYSYWQDAANTTVVPNPASITTDGIYFIRGESGPGCGVTKPVQVKIAKMDVKDPTACGEVNLSDVMAALSEPGFNYTYWTDAAMTIPIANPQSITITGTYYVRGTHASGCSIEKPVLVKVKTNPSFTIIDPPAVDYPTTVNLNNTINASGNYQFSFWKDRFATDKVFRPEAIIAGGTYYAKAASGDGCTLIKPINVIVIPPPLPKVVAPNAFSPNGDGVNETFKMEVKGIVKLNSITIYNRWGHPVFWTKNINTPWDGRMNGKTLPVGTYYWTFDGIDTYRGQKVLSSGSITLLK